MRDNQDMDTRLRLLEVSEALHSRRLDDHEQAMHNLAGALDKTNSTLGALVDRLGSIEKKIVGIGVALGLLIGANSATGIEATKAAASMLGG